MLYAEQCWGVWRWFWFVIRVFLNHRHDAWWGLAGRKARGGGLMAWAVSENLRQ